MSINADTSQRGVRRRGWPAGLRLDGDCYRFDGEIDAETFMDACVSLGRNEAPQLVYDLFYFDESLDLDAYPEIVAYAWSLAERPQGCLHTDEWVDLFRSAGYTHDGKPAALPTEPITIYRGCTPEGQERMAWTSDLAIARRFAHGQLRGRPLGHVYALDATPDMLLAYIHETGRC